MEDHYLLLNELILLLVAATLPVWVVASLIQTWIYKVKGFSFSQYRVAFFVSLGLCFILIALLGLLFWAVVPFEWYGWLRVFNPEGYLSFFFSFILFPPMVLGAFVSAPFVSLLLLRGRGNA